MRLAAYVGSSVALAGGVVLKALHQRANFYSASVYLSQSNANLMILTNLCLLIVGFCVFGLQRLLFGRLRAIETEQLYEKAWFAVTETCLAMTIFRGEMGGWFLVMFVCLLVAKLWGWIGQGRLEILEQQPPSNPRLFHTRLAISLLLSVVLNACLLEYAVMTVRRQARPDMMVMFGFEFAVLTILSASTAARYVITLVELYVVMKQKRVKMAERRRELHAAREEGIRRLVAAGSEANPPPEEEIDEMELDVPGWEDKGRWVFYLDLATDFFKLVVYLCFFAILFTFYGLPIHILRDVVLTMKSFVKRIIHFIRYRNATRDMNERYPDATAEEIASEDVCIICREEMRPWQQPGATDGQPPRIVSERLRAKKLPCGHLLHFACLRSWLERQQNCPTCRRPVAPIGGTGHGINQGGPLPEGIGNAVGPGQPGANQPGAGDPQAGGEARPRAWFLNLGPIRVGFGAGRGDIVRNMVNQMQNGQPGEAPAQPDPNPQPGDAQQLGFGFGFGRRPANTQFNHQNVQLQILQLEQQILQEINSLMATADQLNLVRLLQGELARLRAAQPNQNQGQAATGSNAPAQAAQAATTTQQTSTVNAAPLNQRQFTGSSQSHVMNAGDARLPEGLTLPPGWTLLPLQRVQQAQQGDHLPTHNRGANTSSQSPQPSSSQLFTSPPPSTQLDANAEDTAIPPVSSDQNEDSQQGIRSTSQPTPSTTANGDSSQATQFNSNWSVPNQNLGSNDQTDLHNGWAQRETMENTHFVQEPEEGSSSKGKSRAATVEDVEDD